MHLSRRSMPTPSWAKYAIDAWLVADGISDGPVFRPMNKRDSVGRTT